MSTRNVDIALLRAFVTVAESGSMTQAAHLLHRTQGAVSQQIHRLETLFDTPLLIRTKRGIALTAKGESLLVGAHGLIASNDTLMAQMTGRDITPEIRLGVPPDVVRTLVPPILRAFRQIHPGVMVTLISDGTPSLKRRLDVGEIDLMIGTEARPAKRRDLLAEQKLVWVGAADGEAWQRRPLPVAFAQEGCAFRSSAVELLTQSGTEWRAVSQFGWIEPIIATLEADSAVGVLLENTVPPALRILGADEGLPELPVFYINLALPAGGTQRVAEDLAALFRDAAGAHAMTPAHPIGVAGRPTDNPARESR